MCFVVFTMESTCKRVLRYPLRRGGFISPFLSFCVLGLFSPYFVSSLRDSFSISYFFHGSTTDTSSGLILFSRLPRFFFYHNYLTDCSNLFYSPLNVKTTSRTPYSDHYPYFYFCFLVSLGWIVEVLFVLQNILYISGLSWVITCYKCISVLVCVIYD